MSGSGRMRRTGGLVAAAAVAGLLLVGCSGGASSGDAVAPVAPEPAVEAAEPGGAPADAGSADRSAGEAQSAPGTGTSLADLAEDRDLVVTATTTIRTQDVMTATTSALGVAARYNALVVGQTTSTGTDPGPVPVGTPESGDGVSRSAPTGYASSTLTLRVEPASVDALLTDMAGLGAVVAVTRDVADVTTQVADVDARVRTAQASLARVRALLSRAQNIGDIVALEAELSTRQANLESLQAQQRALADATALATVTVVLVDEATPPEEEPETGFLVGLQRGWDAFTGALAVGLTVLGAALPFLVVVGLVILVVVLILRRTSRRSPATAASPEDRS